MSLVIAAPEYVTAAASDVAGIGSSLKAAHAAAASSTTSVLGAAEDEVSAAIASLFSDREAKPRSVISPTPVGTAGTDRVVATAVPAVKRQTTGLGTPSEAAAAPEATASRTQASPATPLRRVPVAPAQPARPERLATYNRRPLRCDIGHETVFHYTFRRARTVASCSLAAWLTVSSARPPGYQCHAYPMLFEIGRSLVLLRNRALALRGAAARVKTNIPQAQTIHRGAITN